LFRWFRPILLLPGTLAKEGLKKIDMEEPIFSKDTSHQNFNAPTFLDYFKS